MSYTQQGALSWTEVLLNMSKAVNQAKNGSSHTKLTLRMQHGEPGLSMDLKFYCLVVAPSYLSQIKE